MQKEKPLNVIHIIADQHLATCIGAEGNSPALTPNLDRLAEQGVRFRHAYTQNPICTPSRVSILSGQYCHNHGYFGLGGPRPDNLQSFLGHFRQHGYRTAGIGKLHVPDMPSRNWLLDHCDHWADCYFQPTGGIDENTAYMRHLRKHGLADLEDSRRLPEFPGKQQHEGRASNLPYEHCVESWCVDEAKAFISQPDDRPFCMQVSLPRPHQCYTPDARFLDMYPEVIELPATLMQDASHRPPHFQEVNQLYRGKTDWLIDPKIFEEGARRVWRAYLACITQVDHAVGQLLDALEESGLSDQTIVIYNADHGAYSGTHGIPEKALGICSEAVCRVPFIWRIPEGATSHVSDQLVENVDIAPTITSLCGLPHMTGCDGQDLTPLLQGKDAVLREAAVTENVWSKSIRWEKWRLVHYQPETFNGQDIGELYDIVNDPDERNNLYHDNGHQVVVMHGRRLLLEWIIRSNHIVTTWPPSHYETQERYVDDTGREIDPEGIIKRCRAGMTHYL